MAVTKLFIRLLQGVFRGAMIDHNTDRRVWIRTIQWTVTSDQLKYLRNLELTVDQILIEGDYITLILDEKSSKKAIVR